ncbi:hypothetical protein B0H66DRAFT_560019 [Apodospora peruviana]|uniref:Uncharacterized protein n=1 Tax=Apodospora peruviana TaxID=516989 RepID=A0AAE0HZW9_9PEZI|nr:hypothetical protein B0H66DRAFT_560019 [Apodospora peruviana]
MARQDGQGQTKYQHRSSSVLKALAFFVLILLKSSNQHQSSLAKMAADLQPQSPFIARLPREVRDLVYLELWRSSGLRQHIMWHQERRSDVNEAHFCRWTCTTEYDVRDKLQADIEALRVKQGVQLGGKTIHSITHGRRLQSPWMNHWACGERAENTCGKEAVNGITTSAVFTCWKKGYDSSNKSTYLPMMLSCKAISAECLESIYESTTFIFTDTLALQLFLGFSCGHLPPPAVRDWARTRDLPAPGLLQYARNIELSLGASFSTEIPCCVYPGVDYYHGASEGQQQPQQQQQPVPHDAFDFHWLRLARFRNLKTVTIWIAARGLFAPDDCAAYLEVSNQLSADAVRDRILLSGGFATNQVSPSNDHRLEVTLSLPLHRDIIVPRPNGSNEEEGFVEEGLITGTSSSSRIRLWKRGSGDGFQPFLSFINPGTQFDGIINTGEKRYVSIFFSGSGLSSSGMGHVITQ